MRRTAVGVLVGLTTLSLLLYFHHREVMYRSFTRENMGFRRLAELAEAMLKEHSEGVADGPNGAYIVSFDAFYAFVAKHRPNDVSVLQSKNPFSGLLPCESYGHLESKATGPSDLLIWSDTKHHRPIGEIQMRLNCGGFVKDLLQPEVSR